MTTRPSAHVAPLIPHISEALFQTRIEQMCRLLRLRWHHEVDSRRSRKGFPDLVIVGPGGVVFAELKAQNGRVTAEQRDWLADLTTAPGGHRAEVWRPADWDHIEAVLRDLARPTARRAEP